MSTSPISPACSPEEQVQWVLVPVRVSSSPNPPAPNSAGTYSSTYPPTFDFAAYPGMWNQHTDPAYGTFPAGTFTTELFDIDLALSIDAALGQGSCFQTNSSSFEGAPLASSFTDGADMGDMWGAGSPSVSGSSVGSPVTMSPFGAANSTPCSTPPTPELHLCTDPGCYATFSNMAELKRHSRKHRQKQNFCCPLCQKSHLDKRALDRHLWSRHKSYAMKVGAKSEKDKCSYCDYVSRADNVRRHERSQHPNEALGR